MLSNLRRCAFSTMRVGVVFAAVGAAALPQTAHAAPIIVDVTFAPDGAAGPVSVAIDPNGNQLTLGTQAGSAAWSTSNIIGASAPFTLTFDQPGGSIGLLSGPLSPTTSLQLWRNGNLVATLVGPGDYTQLNVSDSGAQHSMTFDEGGAPPPWLAVPADAAIAVAIPAPGGLGILAAGLLGLWFACGRRRNVTHGTGVSPA